MKRKNLTGLLAATLICQALAAPCGAFAEEAASIEWRSSTDEDGNQYDGYQKRVADEETDTEGVIIQNWVAHGYGMYQKTDGSTYQGNYCDGKCDGFGIHTYEDGSRYTGYWESGNADGYGIYYDTEGVVSLMGIWTDGVYQEEACEIWTDAGENSYAAVSTDGNGAGIKLCVDGTVEFGDFVNGELNGYGNMVLTNGDWYCGQFENGVRDGYGIYYFSGSMIQKASQWTDGAENGGTVQINVDENGRGFFATIAENGQTPGLWVNVGGDAEESPEISYGTTVDGARVSHTSEGETIDGEGTVYYTDSTISENYGILLYADGDFFIGLVENGQASEGTLFSVDNPGEFYTGTFSNGAYLTGTLAVPGESTLLLTEYENGQIAGESAGSGSSEGGSIFD